MKYSLAIILCSMIGLPSLSFAKSLCGVATGFAYNQDTIKRPYRLSGFWIKQNDADIRVTFGKSPELIEAVEGLEGSVFVCLDEFVIERKKYAGRHRNYAVATEFRVWLNGELIE